MTRKEVYVEIWLEKDALAGVLLAVTSEFDVPLMVTRGYPSITYLYEAAEAIANQGKPTFLYYFADHDPGDRDITRATEAGLREFRRRPEIHFRRVVAMEGQIALWRLPTRPTKVTDSRKKNFEGESVEVDAIASTTLRALAKACIEPHIDPYQLGQLEKIEQREREALERILGGLESV